MAASNEYQEIAYLLLQHRADESIKNNNNETAADVATDKEIKKLIHNWKN